MLGKVYPKLCFIPPLGTALCPVVKKIALALKTFSPATKIAFPKLIFKDLKSALTANPITATKDVIKVIPKALKINKVLG